MTGVIFDFNGTMVFDSHLHDIAWRRFLQQITGKEIDDDKFIEKISGQTTKAIFEEFLHKKLSVNEAADLEEAKEKIARKLYYETNMLQLAPGLEKFLDTLQSKEVPFTIATSSGLGNVKFYFDTFDLTRWFTLEKVAYSDGKTKGKPAPDLFLKAAENIKVPISDCIIFEDSLTGIKAALAAHARSIVGITSMLNKNTLLKTGADKAIDDYTNPKDLMDFIVQN